MWAARRPLDMAAAAAAGFLHVHITDLAFVAFKQTVTWTLNRVIYCMSSIRCVSCDKAGSGNDLSKKKSMFCSYMHNKNSAAFSVHNKSDDTTLSILAVLDPDWLAPSTNAWQPNNRGFFLGIWKRRHDGNEMISSSTQTLSAFQCSDISQWIIFYSVFPQFS